MKSLQGFSSSLADLLNIALEKLDADDLLSAYLFSDRACNLSAVPDANALLVRATILAKRSYLAEAIADLKSASLLQQGNHNIVFSLLRLCWSDLKNHHNTFSQSLVSLLRQAPKISLDPEAAAWIAGSGLPAMGAAWREAEYIIGWAINTKDPKASLLIELDGGFFPVETGMPTPWLSDAGIGDGYNGFRLKLPASYNLLRIGISGISLWGCPFMGDVPLVTDSPQPLKRSNTKLSETVDIIVPVYSGRAETLACLDAIKASENSVPYRVVVVNDCSTDEILRNELNERAQRNEITLISRPINAGFAGAVNTALSFDSTRDVILLNADTLVFGNWLDRLRAVAYQSDEIETVTPLSNHGELLSYPMPMRNNLVFDVNHAELIDRHLNLAGHKEALSIPAGVGFCFYIKRQALNEVGLFDEGTFGRGYGEDTDFCLRVQKRGWRNVCAANTYVVHWGSKSFGDEKKHLVAKNLHHLHTKYPNHSKEYDQFLADDPLYGLCRNTQRHCLANIVPQYKGTLHMGSPALEEGISFSLKPVEKNPGQWQVRLIITGITGLDTIDYAWPSQFSELKEDILAAGFKCLELKTFGEWPADIIDQLTDGFIPYTILLEDYSGYCPRKYRLMHNAALCSDPIGTAECTKCIAELGSLVYGYKDMISWQNRTQRIFSKANKISMISDEIRVAYIRRFPSLRKRITKNKSILKSPAKLQFPKESKTPLRIAVLSARSLDEGYLQLIEQANKALEHKLAVEFIVFGSTLNDALLQRLSNIHLIGESPQSQIKASLRLHECSAIANFSPCIHIRRNLIVIAQKYDLPLVQDYIAA
jgi:GT2 family glycosyltransferase